MDIAISLKKVEDHIHIVEEEQKELEKLIDLIRLLESNDQINQVIQISQLQNLISKAALLQRSLADKKKILNEMIDVFSEILQKDYMELNDIANEVRYKLKE